MRLAVIRMRCVRAVTCLLLSIISARGVVSECLMTDDECVFHLTIKHRLTMMKDNMAVFPSGRKLYKYDVTNTSEATPMTPEGIIQADGYEPQRLVTVANGTMPGPAIVVYEDQTVIVHVKNELYNEGVSMHWHGLHQKGTPFMDGVSFITQCPILPGQSFTYKFKAKPKGTFWYHSHNANQRTMGLQGPLIIKEKKASIMEEMVMVLQDWNHDDSTTVHLKMDFGGFEERKPLETTDAIDGSHFSRYFMTSGLINGKGRLYDKFGGHNDAPLSIFTVRPNQLYRFRVIAAGHLYPFRVSVHGHELTIVASDGYDLRPEVAESFIINPGERIDFILNTTNAVDNYWIRAQTLEKGVDHKAEAILRYERAPDAEPTSFRRTCSEADPCRVINSPFTYYPIDNTQTVRFDQLKSLSNDDPAPPVTSGKFKEHFLNFAFPGYSHFPGQVNGHKFKMPNVAGLTQMNEIDTTCDKVDCGFNKTCLCTYTLNLTYGDTVQMVFLNMGNGKGWSHPIHLHGHSFYVLKMGYAIQNSSTYQIEGSNMDISCNGDPFCNAPTFENSSWTGDNIPGLELKNPPRKDTIIVPTGGYAVVRIRADNPGLWFMHCHIEMHNADGMAMMINEAQDHYPSPPKSWPRCSGFGPEVIYEPKTNGSDKDNEADKTKSILTVRHDVFWTVVGCLIGVCALQFLILLCMCCRRYEGSGREKYSMEKTPDPKVNHAFDNIEGDLNSKQKF
ncbi:laccase-5-like [Haliotis rufescens]|uniref:laccase-5-like n=1 Tax=Haliotis rufescens TaxID=6454 RepID=UPI00201EB80B|nr:laccase-5-like [Haliotis rufescens]